LHAYVYDTGLIIRIKNFPYDLPFSHNTLVTEDVKSTTDRQTDDNSYYKLNGYLTMVGKKLPVSLPSSRSLLSYCGNPSKIPELLWSN